MRNLLLLHLREQQGLTPRQVADRIGIPVRRYQEYENAGAFIPSSEMELLSVLLRVKKKYLRHYCLQLQLFVNYNGNLSIKEERIQQLTLALKRKFRRTSFQKETIKQLKHIPRSKTTRATDQPTTTQGSKMTSGG